MTADLSLRLPHLEWSFRSSSGRLPGVAWVASELGADHRERRIMRHDDVEAFRQFPYLALLPPYVADEAIRASQSGRATAWEGQSLLFARPEWFVASREYLWAPYSPAPRILAVLAEAFGIEAPLHGYKGDRLSRLAAMVPLWHPARGRLDKAREVLEACEQDDAMRDVYGQGGEVPDALLRDEVLLCRTGTWWLGRKGTAAPAQYRISGGFLRFQPLVGEPWQGRTEDVFLVVDPEKKPNLHAYRLLPSWAVLRYTTRPPPAAARKAEDKPKPADKPKPPPVSRPPEPAPRSVPAPAPRAGATPSPSPGTGAPAAVRAPTPGQPPPGAPPMSSEDLAERKAAAAATVRPTIKVPTAPVPASTGAAATPTVEVDLDDDEDSTPDSESNA